VIPPPPTPPFHALGHRRELFIDDALIARLSGGAVRRMHRPQPKEIVLRHDLPWEGTGCGYHTVFRDGERYRMYYKGFAINLVEGDSVNEDIPHRFTCYAESPDGIHWQKPELGLVEFHGSRANNIVVGSGAQHGVDVDAAHPGIFKDTHPQAPDEARYKGLFGSNHPKGLLAMKSPDGLSWTPLVDHPVITDGAFDSQNLAFWDSQRNEYRAYWRSFEKPVIPVRHTHPDGVRSIRTATSPDLIHWSESQDLTYSGPPNPEELYISQINPYPRAPHLLIGFPARYVERDRGASMQALPDGAHRQMRSRSQPRYGEAITDSLLMVSRDGRHFERWPEAFLPPGPERSGTWNYGHQYLACHVVETASSFAPDGPPELSLYAVENYWLGQHGSEVRRYTLRLDGFFSIQAPMSGGEFLTDWITFAGSELRLNFATSAAGDLRVEVQDGAGVALPGFALDQCEPIFGDATDRPVTWRGAPSLALTAGRPVRLRFALRDADIFAYRFADSP